jgi:hypothetical protein
VEAGGNGVYVGGDAYPTNTGNAANYWVDVVFELQTNMLNTPPTLITTPPDVEIVELTLLTVTNSAVDPDVPAQTLTYTLVEAPPNASIDTNGVIRWTPAENQGPGTNTFATRVSDGLASVSNSFVVRVTETNAAPQAQNLTVSVPEDSVTNLFVVGIDTDVPANALTYALVSQPTNGALSNFNTNSGAAAYTPRLDYHGMDSFTFLVFDGLRASTGLVSITVTPVDDPPKAIDQSVSLAEDSVTNLVLTASDVDTLYNLAETLPVTAVSAPDAWSLGAGANKVSAVASNDGNTSYIASGTSVNTRQQFVLGDAGAVRQHDTITSVTLRSTCARVSKNTNYRLSAALGAAVQAGGVLMAGNGYSQNSSPFNTRPGGGAWTLSDLQSLEARIENLEAQDMRCTQLDALVAYQSDINTTNIVYAILQGPANGVLTGFNPVTGAVTYRANTNYAGADAFRFTATINSVVTTGLVSIGVSPVNDPPQFVGVPADVSIPEQTLLSVTNRAVDVDLPPQTLTYTLLVAPTNAVINTNGVITWIPGVDQGPSTNGIVTRVSDGLASATNSFTVVVLDAGMVLRIRSVTITNEVLYLTWDAVSGVDYVVEYTESLGASNWTVLLPVVRATGPTAIATNYINGVPQRFYRVRQ